MILGRKKTVEPAEASVPMPLQGQAQLLARMFSDLGSPVASDVIAETLAASPDDDLITRARSCGAKLGFSSQLQHIPLANLPVHMVPVFVEDQDGRPMVIQALTDTTATLCRLGEDGGIHQEDVALSTLTQTVQSLYFFPEETDERGVVGRIAAINPMKTLGGQRIMWILLAAFLSNVLGVATSLFVMVVYDRVLPNKALESLYALAIGVALAVLFDTLLRNARTTIIEAATERSDRRVTEDIFDQFVTASSRQSNRKIGHLASVVRDYEHYRDFMTSSAVLAFVDLPFVFVFIYVIWHIAGAVAIVPLLAVPIVICSVLLAQPIVSRSSRDASRVAQNRQSLLVEVLSGLDPLRVSGAYSLLKRKFLSQAGQQRVATNRARDLSSVVGTMIAVVQQAVQVAVIVIGFHLFVSQSITMGAIMGAVILSGRAMGPLSRVGQAMGRISSVRVSYRNLHDFLKTERLNSGEASADLAVTEASENVALEISNITYRPDPEVPALFSNLSAKVKSGEKIAILGRTGSGKTTLLRLLNGLCEPETGGVFAGGKSITSVPRARLPHHIGTVFQSPWLFAGTLYENVSMGHEVINDDVVQDALSAVGMGQFSLDHNIAEQGANLSGGQKQAVNVARALAFDPPILLMDEPTSAMDAQLEGRVVSYLKTEKSTRTMVIVTHKSALISLCDRVWIMDRGQIVEDITTAEYHARTQSKKPTSTVVKKAPGTLKRRKIVREGSE